MHKNYIIQNIFYNEHRALLGNREILEAGRLVRVGQHQRRQDHETVAAVAGNVLARCASLYTVSIDQLHLFH